MKLKLNKLRLLTLIVFLLSVVDVVAGPGTCPETGRFSDFTSPTATVAIHVSENTTAGWPTLGGPHVDWPRPWHIYGFLMEQLRSDGTPFDVVTDADITRGKLVLAGGAPRYAILFSLADDCISEITASRIEAFVRAGGHAFVGSTSWTRNERCELRGVPGGTPIYEPTDVIVTAENSFSADYSPANTVDSNCDNLWINQIRDSLPTWIQYRFPAARIISRVGLIQSNYERLNLEYTYRIRNYEVQVAIAPSCADADFRRVATVTLPNVSGHYQETRFAPTTARCVRIVAQSSYESRPYPGADTRHWVGLTSFQAFEAATNRPLINHLCAPSRLFALSSQMGLTFGIPIKIQSLRRTGEDDPLVSHLPNDDILRNWALATSYRDSNFDHDPHWAQNVIPTSATTRVLAKTGEDNPILTVRNYGAGRFIYHSEFNPLAGYTMHTVASHVYGFYRTAIDQAHAARSLPLVRLGAWPYPNVAAFMTRHDHVPNRGFDTTFDPRGCSREPACTTNCCEDHRVAQIEHSHGVRGSYFLRTGPTTDPAVAEALPLEPGSGPCSGGATDCLPQIKSNIAYMVELGALFGSHTTNERINPCDFVPGHVCAVDTAMDQPVRGSLDRLQKYLPLSVGGHPVRPRIFVTPGALAIYDETIQGLADAGITSTGDIAYGAHPHFALRMGSLEYNNRARFSIIEIPATSYFAPVVGGPTRCAGCFWGSGIWSHQISSDPPNCTNDGTWASGRGVSCMRKAANLMHRLGGLINIYDHIGDPHWIFVLDRMGRPAYGKPTAAQFERYIEYAQRTLPYVWTTNTVDIESWWRRKDIVRVRHSYTKTPRRVTVELSCATDTGPFSVEVTVPWAGPVEVKLDGVRTSSYAITGSRIRVYAPVPSTVAITERR